MESIYWVLTWACHRRCRHCYDDRFRPYGMTELSTMVAAQLTTARAVLANLPDDFSFREATPGGVARRRRGRLVLAGGEVLLDGVREELFYPVLDGIRARWGGSAPHVSIQTTGDLLTPRFVEEMLARGVGTIAIAGMDDHHVGLEGDRKLALMERIRGMMAPYRVTEIGLGLARDARLGVPSDPRLGGPQAREDDAGSGPFFLFFGAQPELWIGELWPRGRAFTYGLSQATYATNFCARWSGGKRFLDHDEAGSEVAIAPDGSVYPCCLKTGAPLGNLADERLLDVLASLRGHPAFEAINDGDPERMGETAGWSRDAFRTAATVTDPTGRTFANVCLGCDAYFAEHLGAELERIRTARLAARRP